ncbi:MAG: DUF4249 family protein [Candidatus Eisenbacteria sp.]|nr:DUF4249 family protein [Candidatus Eisenbacteria bacterium]
MPLAMKTKKFDRLAQIAVSLGLVLVVFSGCGEDVNKPGTESTYVLFGYLYVGETVSEENAIFLAWTRSIEETYQREDAVVSGAVVTLRREGSVVRDTLEMVEPGYYANPDVAIGPLETYHLDVYIGGNLEITSTTTTPNAFTIETDLREAPLTMVHGDIPDSFGVLIDSPDETQIFMVDIYCTEDWQDAVFLEGYQHGQRNHPDDYERYGGDNSEPRHICAFFALDDLEKDGDRFVLDWYSAMMVFQGTYDVAFLTIDDNYYNYLYRDFPERNAGVVGGIGVFASACRKAFCVEVVE